MGGECGQIVRSLAGHDKGELFCVLDAEGGCLLLCDGRRRRLENPKRKREKHTQLLGTLPQPGLEQFQAGNHRSNRDIRRALAAFRAEQRRV